MPIQYSSRGESMTTREELASRRSALSAQKRAILEQRLRDVGATNSTDAQIPRRPDGIEIPLSFAQQRLWFLNRLEPASPAYNEAVAIRISGALDAAALQRAVQAVALRHEILRCTFSLIDGSPRQIVHPAPHPDLTPPVVDLRNLPEARQPDQVHRRLCEEASRIFDLEEGPLARFTIFQTGGHEHYLVHAMHHIVSDGWSMGIFVREITTLYSDFVQGRTAALDPLPIQYADFASWQREEEISADQLAFWKEHLRGAPTFLQLPTDRPRPPVQTHRGAEIRFEVPDETFDGLRQLARIENATLFMILLAAFAALLYRYSEQDDILIGTPIAGRTRPELEPLIGFFINTLVVRTNCSGNPSFRDFLDRVRTSALASLANQEIPFERLVEEIQPARSLSHTPLFQVMFVFENFPRAVALPLNLHIEQLDLPNRTAKFDLTLVLREMSGGLSGEMEYNAELFRCDTIEAMVAHFRLLLDAIVEDPERSVATLRLLSADEERRLRMGWSGASLPAPECRLLPDGFCDSVRRAPSDLAIRFGGQELTYSELSLRVDALVDRLCSLGVGRESPLAVFTSNPLNAVQALLAIIASGAVYVPLHPANPLERLKWILAHVQPLAVLADDPLLPFADGLPVVAFEDAQVRPGLPPRRLPLAAGDAACIMYTSGTSSRSKGVVLSHGALAQHIAAARAIYEIGPTDRVLQLGSYAVDPFLEQCFAALTSGARLVLSPHRLPTGSDLARHIAAEELTVLDLPTALWRQVVAEWLADDVQSAIRSLRLMIVGGEAMLTSDVERWMNSPLRCIRLFNAYGPTETAITATCYELTAGDAVASPVAIGRPLPGRSVYVLDRNGEVVPTAVPGELYIGGSALARCYLGDTALTEERFVPDPWSMGGRLFRTGDRVRFRSDGNLQYLGRADDQVKIRGFRVDPCEVEAALLTHPDVRDAAVAVWDSSAGDRYLAAYVVQSSREQTPTAERVRSFLRDRLPDFMLPRTVTVVDELPINISGKVDRNRLPRSTQAEIVASPDAEPRNAAERAMCQIWAEALGRERIGIHEDFFVAGGHSLLAIRVIARVRKVFQAEVSVQALFEFRAIAEFTPVVLAAAGGPQKMLRPPLRRFPPSPTLPLTPAQQELWTCDRASPGAPFFNITSAARLIGAVDGPCLAKALGHVARRHQSLRATFKFADHTPIQMITQPSSFDLEMFDLRGSSDDEQGMAITHLQTEYRMQRFDLATGPLMRVGLARVGEEDHVLLSVLHHIAADGWSLDLISKEAAVLYEQLSTGRTPELPELPIQFADYLLWQQDALGSQYFADLQAYWVDRLSGRMPMLPLPADHHRSGIRSFRYGHADLLVPDEIARELSGFGKEQGATLFMVLLAGFTQLLHLYTGSSDVRIGTMSAGRTLPQLEPLVGLLANTLVLRTDVSGEPTFRELLARVRRTTLEAFDYQDLPFEVLKGALTGGEEGSPPCLQVLFLFENGPAPFSLAGACSAPLGRNPTAANVEVLLSTFDLIIEAEEGPPLKLTLKYDTDLYSLGSAQSMLERLLALFSQGLSHPDGHGVSRPGLPI
jgi:amino acid adenylation domain-containing protein